MPGKKGDVTVTLSAAGIPVSFVLDGRTWHVGAEPVRWYERIPWWETKTRMSRRDPMARIDVEVWQLQARLGRNRATELTTFEILHDATGWRVRSSS
jgi:hypothetical protein